MNITANNAACFFCLVAMLIVQGAVVILLPANCMAMIKMRGYVLFKPVSDFME